MNIVTGLKQVQVDFQNNVDTSLFKQRVYSEICINGLYLTDLNMMHCASIHYQSRFLRNIARTFRYTFDTIEPSLFAKTRHFYFNDNEEPELQKQSSEVIGVGFAISLFQQLFDVNFNAFQRILPQGSQKRCDFEVVKNGRRILLESKGRKQGLQRAINEIVNQKNPAMQTPKYGCISIIPRNSRIPNNPVTITVVDPPFDPESISKEQRILQLLTYYTRVSQLCGLKELAFHLNKKIKELTAYPKGIFQPKPLEYRNVLKFGRMFGVDTPSKDRFYSFFSPDLSSGFKRKINDKKIVFFAMDQTLVNILEKQDYGSLLEYKLYNDSLDEEISASIHNDGTMLAVIPVGKFPG